jgi:hypothetical protein
MVFGESPPMLNVELCADGTAPRHPASTSSHQRRHIARYALSIPRAKRFPSIRTEDSIRDRSVARSFSSLGRSRASPAAIFP